MNSRYQNDDDLQDLRDSRGQDREISLGTTTILGIFFALALLCAVFFGFGYSLGKRSTPPVVSAAELPAASSESSAPKPAPGSPATHAASTLPATPADDAASTTIVTDAPTTSSEATQPAPALTRVKAVAADFRTDPPTRPATLKPAAVASTPATPGAAIVQVAAVSHQEDADVLIKALKHRGYNVAVHHEPQDKLLHVQIGPFPIKKDADAMKQRLQTDGYNAIVK
ncbi:SPOR domain-containing protein [Tunturibacter psychrotolerans]|uniref:SPOR domain-containing protein n=1 Tax=Tunturiibacter psychrotolerans TaxID=3069686 RepID=A0AAU7ZV62_9BACT